MKHLLLILVIALILRLPVSGNPLVPGHEWMWSAPIVGTLFVGALYGCVRELANRHIALLFGWLAALYVPLIWLHRSDPVATFQSALVVAAFWALLRMLPGRLPRIIVGGTFVLAGLFFPLLAVPAIAIASAVIIDLLSATAYRQIAVVLGAFLTAFVAWHLVNWDEIFVREHASLRDDMHMLAEHLQDKTVYVIDAESRFLVPLQSLFAVSARQFSPAEFQEDIERSQEPLYVLAIGEYQESLSEVKDIVFREEWIQNLLITGVDAMHLLPVKPVARKYRIALVKVATRLDNL